MKYLKWDYTPFVPIFDLVNPYLPFHQDLLDVFQKNLSEAALHCAIHYSQNNVNAFLKSVIYPDQLSSLFVSILNSTSLVFPTLFLFFLLELILCVDHMAVYFRCIRVRRASPLCFWFDGFDRYSDSLSSRSALFSSSTVFSKEKLLNSLLPYFEGFWRK